LISDDNRLKGARALCVYAVRTIGPKWRCAHFNREMWRGIYPVKFTENSI